MAAGIAKLALLGAATILLQSPCVQSFNTSAPPLPSVTPTPTSSCPGSFTPISAPSFITNMNPSWNLGNTLDAIQSEGDWNNPPVTPITIDDAKAAGFKGIRLPVTWAYHFISSSPTWTVDPAWLQRVSDVVDMVTSRGLYTIVNVHHDSWIWADITQPNANITAIEERFYSLWYQIGLKLACKSHLVAFEPINEPPGTTPEHGAQQNRMNDIFLRAINAAGGWNGGRVVTLAGSSSDGVKTSLWFRAPEEKYRNPWALQFHYYSPYDFIFSAWGKTTWGSAADISALTTDLTLIRNNFTNIPLIIGEWAASPVATETGSRWRYFDAFLRAAAGINATTVLWDNGADFLNRGTHVWRDEVALDILRNTVKGVKNALPGGTTDPAATKQDSSAYVYVKANASVLDVELLFSFNGNTLQKAAVEDRELDRGTDYDVDTAAETITFKKALLESILSTPTAPATGSIANITLAFSLGADLLVNVLRYSTPVLRATSSALPATSSDLLIPISWAGQNRPATVKAVKSDGVFLVDDWTQYLPPLQQGRMTYGGQWDWDGQNVILKAAVLEAVRAAGLTTTFTIEFYPRVEGNSVVYTLTV